MSGIVVRNIRRADAAAIASLARLGVATVHEAQGRIGLMQPHMRPLWRGARIAGSAVTALCHPGDNWMIHVAVEVLVPGDVLVVACSSENTDGAFGELLATSLKARGASGVVLDMGCRDAHEITEMRFPLWSRANAESVARAAEEREKKEAATRARLERGELGLDIYGMRKALEDKGLKYIDGPVD